MVDRKRKAEPTETVEVEQSPEKKPKRGAATVKAVEETVKRTRNMMKKEGATEAESEATPIATGRARRGASETPVKPILARVKKQVTIMTPSTIALAEKTTKATTSRVIKSTITEEPVSKRPTRSRK